MTRYQMVTCICGGLLRLNRSAAGKVLGRERGKLFVLYGGVCDCGRGIDLLIERRPGSRGRHG